jgi:hypothetical protein
MNTRSCFSHGVVSMSAHPYQPLPELDLAAEATHVSVRAVPGAVFVLMRRDRPNQYRRMFAELTLAQARALQSDLAAVIREASDPGPEPEDVRFRAAQARR